MYYAKSYKLDNSFSFCLMIKYNFVKSFYKMRGNNYEKEHNP